MDREAIIAALKTLRPYNLEDIRMVHIKNTLELTTLMVSRGCLDSLEGKPDQIIGDGEMELEFDSSGDLISRIGNVKE